MTSKREELDKLWAREDTRPSKVSVPLSIQDFELLAHTSKFVGASKVEVLRTSLLVFAGRVAKGEMG